jgi:hypothetical protein
MSLTPFTAYIRKRSEGKGGRAVDTVAFGVEGLRERGRERVVSRATAKPHTMPRRCNKPDLRVLDPHDQERVVGSRLTGAQVVAETVHRLGVQLRDV